MNSVDNKKIYIEAMRIFAAFFVIFNHTGLKGFFIFSVYPEYSLQYWVYSFFSIFCKFSVPLFFAISGAVLIPKDESIRSIYIKRVFRLIIILFLTSLIYYFKDIMFDRKSSFSVLDFLETLITSNHCYHLWYLYAFIPFLISLPIIKVLARNINGHQLFYMIVLAFIFYSIKPIVEFIIWHGDKTINSYFDVPWITSLSIIYPCIGYYIEHKLDMHKYSRLKIFLLWIINIMCIVMSSMMTMFRARIIGTYREGVSQVFHSTFVMINVIVLFISFKLFFCRRSIPQMLQRIIVSLGDCTFGVYLFHVIIKDFVDSYNLYDILLSHLLINKMVVCLMYTAIIFFICVLITMILKNFPIVKKLL